MTPEDRTFIRDFHRRVTHKPLDPDDPRYVELYAEQTVAPADPVELLARAIEFTPGESVQLLSGFRGTGKSTELRRLRKRLQEAGYLVILTDIEDYLNLTTPIDVSDFLLAVAGAFSDALASQDLLGSDPQREGYWERFVNFLTRTKVEISEVSGEFGVPGGTVAVRANLKNDPNFKQRLQERMAGHVGALVNDVRTFIEESVKSLKQRHGQDKEVVLLLDSIEHIR